MRHLGIIIGSLRRDAFTKKIAAALCAELGKDYVCETLDIDLPMYNQDLDDKPPMQWEHFRLAAAACDAYIFVTPEYNRSFPAVIKNALDIGSRPYGKNLWAGKPAMLVSVSPGALGGCFSSTALRQTMNFLDIRTMQQPEAYIGNVASSLDAEGKPNEKLAGFLKTLASGFKEWLK